MLNIFGDAELDSLLYDCYKNKNNYKERIVGSNVLLIFCTSYGLWEEPKPSSFKQRVIDDDYYEYYNVTQSKYFANKKYDAIFVRDIYLSWYAYGINEGVNSQAALISFLSEKAKPYDEVIVVGGSSGGYAALLFGTQINASKIMVFSPQNNLDCYFSFYKNSNKYYYFNADDGKVIKDLFPLMKEYKGKIYYFYAKYEKVDNTQYAYLTESPNVIDFPIKSDEHGRTLLAENMLDVICASDNKLKRLSKWFKGKEMSTIGFCFWSSGIFRFTAIITRKLKRAIAKKNKHIL